jgi:alpha-beta hydrolase superfamily lysophospholipase
MSIALDEGPVTQRATAGPPLWFASAMPESGAKAVVGMIPGYADHGARYAHVMGALAEHGIGSVVIDLRGHGRAGGSRGYCNRFGEFLDDVKELGRLLDARGKGLPQFLFGHSFGGLTAATSALADPAPWKGLVLSAPFFGLAMEVPRLKVLGGRVASRVYPKLAIPSSIPSSDLTHDVEKARAYDDDPLVFKNATARWFTEATKAQARALEDAPRLRMPLYVTFGTADRIASFAAGKRFFDAAGSMDKTWDPREGLFHEVLNEPSWKEIVDPIASWLRGHLQ